MWKVLGMKAVPVTIGHVWKERLMELTAHRKGATRFRGLIEQADLNHFHDAINDIHTFFLRFDPSTPTEDMEFLRDHILMLHELSGEPVVSFNGEPQLFTVVFTAEEEVDRYQRRALKIGEDEGTQSS